MIETVSSTYDQLLYFSWSLSCSGYSNQIGIHLQVTVTMIPSEDGMIDMTSHTFHVTSAPFVLLGAIASKIGVLL